jgi:deazaflavin-dependent oxidoreductase (nitroreductase family)
MTPPDPSLASEDYCYLTTTGRKSGEPRTIEIWFGLEGSVLYMLAGSGARADWVRNFQEQPAVQLRIGETTYRGRARVIADGAEDALARRLLVEKYTPRHHNSLESWGREALPVAIDFD